jgi:uncharacterized integral membrane protein
MTDPIDPPPRQPVADQPGVGPLDDPGDQAYRRPVTGPVPGTTPADRTAPAPGFDEKGHVKHTRTSGVWIGLIGTAVFLILLIIFIAQNSHKASLHFFGWHGQFSLALTILLSAVIGVLLVAIPGTVRIVQLRRALRKNGPGLR